MYEPQGPHPREVYVRRRILAVGAIALVIIAIASALYLASRSDGTDTQDTANSSQDGPAVGATESETSAAPTSDAEASAAADSASRGRCADNDIAAKVWPAAPNVKVGSPLTFFAQVENTSKTTCDRDLNGAPLSFEVYRLDTNSKVWSSIDCTTPRGEDKAVLQPGKPVSRQIEWTGRRSAQGSCSEADRLPAEVGYYQVYALVGKVFSPAATFNIVQSD